jgi:CelD/BcsL family acetyltransferase involved in cellulose biosynthesis
MTIDVIDDLSAIRSEWEDLWSRVPAASPFQHPAWLMAWAQPYAPGRCRAATLWHDGYLEAVVPAFVWDGALLLAGTGPSDHAAALLSCESEQVALLVNAICEASPEPFDRIDFRQLASSSPLPGERDGEPCLVVDLEGPDGMARASSRTRSHWRHAIRQLESEGAAFDLVGSGEASQAADELQRLHGLRWRAQGEEGALADELAQRHLAAATPELARAGLLRMHRLRVGNRTIALVFAMRGAQSTCFYLSGFDPAWAKLSPGTALVGTAIAHAAKEGCAEADFLRGREHYKYKWGARERPTRRLVGDAGLPLGNLAPGSGRGARGRTAALERAKGFEPSTPTLARLCSTPELRPLIWRFGRRTGGRVAGA